MIRFIRQCTAAYGSQRFYSKHVEVSEGPMTYFSWSLNFLCQTKCFSKNSTLMVRVIEKSEKCGASASMYRRMRMPFVRPVLYSNSPAHWRAGAARRVDTSTQRRCNLYRRLCVSVCKSGGTRHAASRSEDRPCRSTRRFVLMFSVV